MRTVIDTKATLILAASWLDTKLGRMMAIADEENLYLLEFMDNQKLEYKIKYLQKSMCATIITEKINAPIASIKKEIDFYFEGKLEQFKTPTAFLGSPFQKKVWQELQKIPYGKTVSYTNIAENIKNPTAFRAAANANGANLLSIIIPCHRVINTNGKLGGYSGSVYRKEWLLKHEKRIAS